MKKTNYSLSPAFNRIELDALYGQYNRREFIHPDPLEFLYHYEELRDREIVGLIASSLAYGKVAQILRSVSSVLDKMGPSPWRFLSEKLPESFHDLFKGFKHRFTTGEQMGMLLFNIKSVIERYGSLEACFMAGLKPDDSTVLPALTAFVEHFRDEESSRMFVPSPDRGSACKRLNLFLRWMTRSDDVDPGGWHGVSPSMLIIPLDTHMYRISSSFGLTTRKQADMRTAVEITEGFRAIAPEDPVRYDFALTRLGIRDGMDI